MKFEIKDLINKIEYAAAKGIEYKDIAESAGIRVETLWKIRKRKTRYHNTGCKKNF